MLVLTRKLGEKILIGEKIVITLVELRRDKARIGIDAPRDVLILREEVPREEKPVTRCEKETSVSKGGDCRE